MADRIDQLRQDNFGRKSITSENESGAFRPNFRTAKAEKAMAAASNCATQRNSKQQDSGALSVAAKMGTSSAVSARNTKNNIKFYDQVPATLESCKQTDTINTAMGYRTN